MSLSLFIYLFFIRNYFTNIAYIAIQRFTNSYQNIGSDICAFPKFCERCRTYICLLRKFSFFHITFNEHYP